MRVAAISDLHIGLDERTDAFGHEPKTFAAFLDELLATHDRVVLLGDVFTADHAAVWGGAHARVHLRRILTRVPWLADRIADPRVHYVRGNHDVVAGDVLGAADRVVLTRGSVRVLFVHGHQFDPVARRALRLAQAGTWATGRIRAAGIPALAQWFEDRDVAIKDARFRGVEGPYAQAANALCRDVGVSAVVMGHTHAARVDHVEHGVSLNTGTCSGGRFEMLSLDLAAGSGILTRGFERVPISFLK
ncbi:MAG: metallophosphoesterase family protein [Nannocystales bacterium]